MNYLARKSAKIKATNAANAFLNHLQNRFHVIFAPFIGQRVILANGVQFTNAVRKAIEADEKQLKEVFGEVDGVSYYFSFSRYSVRVTARAWVQGDGITYYAEPSAYVLDISENNVLQKIFDKETRRSDWTVEEVENLRKELALLKGKVSTLEGTLEPFARWDS